MDSIKNKFKSLKTRAVSAFTLMGGGAGRLGFTLAEALLTLLIISIIVALSTAIIAKKNKKLRADNQTHYWYCTRTSYNGSHTSSTNFNPAPGSHTADSCTFSPPAGVNKFNVTVIGGGGGGASGYASRESEQVFTPGTYTFKPLKTDSYYLILIGGGGGGGGKKSVCHRNDTGGHSAAMIHSFVNLDKNTTYVVTVGNGGGTRTGSHSGKDGENSTFSGGGYSYVAGAGGGGNRCTRKGGWRPTCSCKGGGSPGTFSPSNVSGTNGVDNNATIGAVLNCNSSGSCKNESVANWLPTGYKEAGNGGNGEDSGKAHGKDGIALVQRLTAYGGGGGQAGSLAFYQYKYSPGDITVFVGEGGAGATQTDQDGKDGTSSRFGTKIVSAGGRGGKARANTVMDGYVSLGEDGYMSLLPTNLVNDYSYSSAAAGGTASSAGAGGGTPGAGGGGGGADGLSSAWSAGGNGAAGIVVVTW